MADIGPLDLSYAATNSSDTRSIYFTYQCDSAFERQRFRRKTAKNSPMKRPTKKRFINVENTDHLQTEGSLSQTIQCHSDVRLGDSFFNVPCEELAKRLLGKVLVRRLDDGTILKGRIVETESYLGGEDKASHSYKGRVTERNKPMYMNPGTAYVYLTYGMYHCFNISSQGLYKQLVFRSSKLYLVT